MVSWVHLSRTLEREGVVPRVCDFSLGGIVNLRGSLKMYDAFIVHAEWVDGVTTMELGLRYRERCPAPNIVRLSGADCVGLREDYDVHTPDGLEGKEVIAYGRGRTLVALSKRF